MTSLAQAARLRPPLAGGVRVVAIEGRSGAGTTVLADALAAETGWPVFHMDEVCSERTGPAASVELLALWVVMPLLNGADPRWRRYDRKLGRPAEWHSIPVVDGLIVEGCGCGAAEIRPYLSTLVWVDTPDGVRHQCPDAQDDAAGHAPHRATRARQEESFYAEHSPWEYADVVVDGAALRRSLRNAGE
ncbi:nucleoside/nucleotide kinase family protein [Thermobifida halotolerans]|uniref:hypothetical protein n=1 Tax=Thermobifida halotolerans TaxID=483545 RepID=UPI000AFD14E0|nr:hypothetical protein [Thermobifida halotolerans]